MSHAGQAPSTPWALLATANGALAVAAGAFGAHAMDAPGAELLETGARWQVISALAGLIAARMGARIPAALHGVGGALFAASLYALALGAPTPVAYLTPLGGLAMLAGWVALGAGMVRARE